MSANGFPSPVSPAPSAPSAPSAPPIPSIPPNSSVNVYMVTDENVRKCLADFANHLDTAEAAFNSLRSAQTTLSQVVDKVPNDINNGIAVQALQALQLSSDIQEVDANVQANRVRVQGLSSDVTKNKNSLSQLSEIVSTLSEEVKTLSSDQKSLSKEVKSLSKEFKSLSEKVDKIAEKLEGHNNYFVQILARLPPLGSKPSGLAE